MSIELLVQMLGGITGIAIAYAWYRIDERRLDRIDAELAEQHRIEMEEIRKQALKIKR